MNKLFPILLFIAAITFSCKEKTENAETNSETTTENVSELEYLVHLTNKAWANAEELNKRVSPPKTVIDTTQNNLQVAIHFSSPFVKNRTIWDSLVPYNQVWRTGANEATIIEFNENVKIGDQTINAGSYSLFTIPTENQFTVILNSVADQWGAYEYDESKDVIRFELPAVEREFTESLEFWLNTENEMVKVYFAWEKLGFEFNLIKAD